MNVAGFGVMFNAAVMEVVVRSRRGAGWSPDQALRTTTGDDHTAERARHLSISAASMRRAGVFFLLAGGAVGWVLKAQWRAVIRLRARHWSCCRMVADRPVSGLDPLKSAALERDAGISWVLKSRWRAGIRLADGPVSGL